MKSILHPPSSILGLALIAGCWLLVVESSVTLAAAPGGPILTVTATPAAMIQDSTNLLDWQDVVATSELTVLASSTPTFFRGEAQPTILLTWDATPSATGYKIYWGNASHTYLHCLPVGNVTTIALTVSDPGAVVYACVTALESDAESDPSNEKNYVVPAPVMAIRRN